MLSSQLYRVRIQPEMETGTSDRFQERQRQRQPCQHHQLLQCRKTWRDSDGGVLRSEASLFNSVGTGSPCPLRRQQSAFCSYTVLDLLGLPPRSHNQTLFPTFFIPRRGSDLKSTSVSTPMSCPCHNSAATNPGLPVPSSKSSICAFQAE